MTLWMCHGDRLAIAQYVLRTHASGKHMRDLDDAVALRTVWQPLHEDRQRLGGNKHDHRQHQCRIWRGPACGVGEIFLCRKTWGVSRASNSNVLSGRRLSAGSLLHMSGSDEKQM
jgi:hypothetical protein